MQPVSIIGLGLSTEDLTETHKKIIAQADIIVGGKRHLDFFPTSKAEKRIITGEIKKIVDYVKKKMDSNSIVVLASGDPLFFGIGSLMIKSLGAEKVKVYPNITSVAAAFSRIREPWQDACVLSMHGRFDKKDFFSAVLNKDKIAILTDPENNPAKIAGLFISSRNTDFEICVLEKLGSIDEKIEWYTLNKAAESAFNEPNIVILKRLPTRNHKIGSKIGSDIFTGMPEEYFDHENGLITKAEVRAVSLSKLRLLSDSVFWDLGAGSGSVSIEASAFIKTGKIIAVEQNKSRIKQIENNMKQFRVPNMEIVRSRLPEGLEDLPVPDRIFIGGGGENLESIILSSCKYLNKQGIVVVNTVLMQNIVCALSTFKNLGFKTDIVQIQISRGSRMPWGERLEAQNPVWIISGLKEKRSF